MKKVLVIALYCLANLAFADGFVKTPPGGSDPDSFGRSLTYLGLAQTANVWFSPDCNSNPVAPPDVCVEVPTTVLGPNGDNGTSFAVSDLGSMVIPGGSTHSLIWPVMIGRYYLGFVNPPSNMTGIRATAMVNLDITIESEVLNDPSITDQTTGLPANGKFVVSLPFPHGIDQMPVQFLNLRERADGAGIGSFALGFLRDSLGLNKKQLADLLKHPITLRFGLSGTVRNAQGYVMAAIRVMGD